MPSPETMTSICCCWDKSPASTSLSSPLRTAPTAFSVPCSSPWLCPASHFAKVPAAVQDSPNLHDIANDYIEDREIPRLNAVVGVLPLFGGAVGFKGLRAMQSLLYRELNGVHQIFSGNGVLKLERDVVHDLVQVLLLQLPAVH